MKQGPVWPAVYQNHQLSASFLSEPVVRVERFGHCSHKACKNLYLPKGIMNMVTLDNASSKGICQNPHFASRFSLVNIQWAPLAHLITCEKQQAVYQALNSHTCGSCTVCTCGPNCIRPIAMLSCDTSSGLTLRSTTWNLSWPCSQTNNVVPSALIVCPLYAMRFTFSCELRAQWCVAVGQV